MTPAELAQLDFDVAVHERLTPVLIDDECWLASATSQRREYRPSTDSAQAEALRAYYRLSTSTQGDGFIALRGDDVVLGSGPTPHIAICRAVLALPTGESHA